MTHANFLIGLYFPFTALLVSLLRRSSHMFLKIMPDLTLLEKEFTQQPRWPFCSSLIPRTVMPTPTPTRTPPSPQTRTPTRTPPPAEIVHDDISFSERDTARTYAHVPVIHCLECYYYFINNCQRSGISPPTSC